MTDEFKAGLERAAEIAMEELEMSHLFPGFKELGAAVQTAIADTIRKEANASGKTH